MTTSNGSTVPSSAETFEKQTAEIPETITGEVLPPAPGRETEPEPETGWPLWDLQQIFSLPFFFMERRYGDLWQVTDAETERVARAWKPIIDRYFPLEETEWGTALLVTLAILAPRALMTDWDKPKNGKPTPPGNTKTAGSGESPATSANAKAESQPEWDPFSVPSRD